MKQRAIVLATACAVGLGLIVVSIPPSYSQPVPSTTLPAKEPATVKAQQPVPPKVLSGEQATNLLVEELAKSASISVEDARRATNQAKPILDFIRAHESDPAFGDVWADYTGGQYSVHLRLTDAADPTGLQSALTRSLGSAVQRHVGGAQHLGVQAAVSSAIQLTGDALLDRQTAATVVYDQVAGEARSTTDDKVLQGALKAIKNVRVVPEAAITAEPTSYGGDDSRQTTYDGTNWTNRRRRHPPHQ